MKNYKEVLTALAFIFFASSTLVVAIDKEATDTQKVTYLQSLMLFLLPKAEDDHDDE